MKQSVQVIINVKNGERTIARALYSCQCQSVPVDILVINNQSQDETRAICEEFGVKVVDTIEPLTLAQARNFAMQNANDAAKYITFLDADDEYIDPEAVAKLTGQLGEQYGMVCSQAEVRDSKGDFQKLFTKSKKQEFNTKDILRRYEICWSTLCIDMTSVGNVRFDPSLDICEDIDFVYRLSLHTKLKFVQEPLVAFYVHGDSTLLRNLSKYRNELLYLAQKYNLSFQDTFFLILPYIKLILRRKISCYFP